MELRGGEFTTPCVRKKLLARAQYVEGRREYSPEGEGNNEVEGDKHEAFEPV